MGLRLRSENSALYQPISAKTDFRLQTTLATVRTSSVAWPDGKVMGLPLNRSVNTKSDSDAGLIAMIVILAFLITGSAAAYFLIRRYFEQQRARIAARATARRNTLRSEESGRANDVGGVMGRNRRGDDQVDVASGK
ncbi:hypothetical protein GGR57DRAFT_507918 [Xylariaceae sp. FL1272]|nr:hypothetical protein GGR57DRAFT_507918 [Xylariaceae sp. FL1272]